MSLTRNPDRDSLPTELLREYELVGEELLGEGAFAVVRLMRHIQTGELFALKCVEKHPLRIRNMIGQMQREVRIQHSLVHPNILRLVRTFDEQAYVYMLLEYCGKGPLRALLQQQPHNRLAEPLAVKYFEQIVKGVECMHRNSYVHRDLKLENMLLTDDDVVKICDFGWSAEASIEETLQTTCGTTSYWAPEIWEGGLQDEAVDLWALGCLLYEMLAGHPPFYEQDQGRLKHKVLAVEFGWPPWMSNEACHVVHVLLQRAPAKRAKAADLLKHPWLSKYKGSSRQSFSEALTTAIPEAAEQPATNGNIAAVDWQRPPLPATVMEQVRMVQPPLLPQGPLAPGTPGPPRRLASSYVAAQPSHQLAEDVVPRSGSFVFPQAVVTPACTTPHGVPTASLAAIGRCHSVHATPPITPARGPPRGVLEQNAFPAEAVGSIQMRMMQAPPVSTPARESTMRQSLPRAVFAEPVATVVAATATPSRMGGQIITGRFTSPSRRAMTPGPDRRSASPLPRSITQAGMAAHGFADSTSAYPGFFQSDQAGGTHIAAAAPMLPTRASMVLPVPSVGLVLPAPQPIAQPSTVSAAMPLTSATGAVAAPPQSPLATTRACAPGTGNMRPASPAALRIPSPGALRPPMPGPPAPRVTTPSAMAPPTLPASSVQIPGFTAYNTPGLPRSSSGKLGQPGNSIAVKPSQRCGTSYGLLSGLPASDIQGVQTLPSSANQFGPPMPPLFV